jgi:putative sterol carrier protein
MDKKIDFEQLYKLLAAKFYKMDVSKVTGKMAFEFHVKDMEQGIFYVEVNGGQVSVAPYNYYDRNALITASGETFYDIVSGKLNAKIAYAVGLITVEGDQTAAIRFWDLWNA